MRLRKDMNIGTLAALPRACSAWRPSLPEQLGLLRTQGYEGVQAWDGFDAIARAGLQPLALARVLRPGEVAELARRHRDAGVRCTTLHLGTGFESDAQMDALAVAVLEAQASSGHCLLVETHRATATQDIWRTLQWVERFPDLRFTADLSHWYTGHELTYGGEFDERSARLEPVLRRSRAVHGRIGNSGCLQTPLDRPGPYLQHYRALWTALCRGFQETAEADAELGFAPELLPMAVGDPPLWLHYQQTTHAAPGDAWEGEPCDRWADAQTLWAWMQQCWDDAWSASGKRLTT